MKKTTLLVARTIMKATPDTIRECSHSLPGQTILFRGRTHLFQLAGLVSMIGLLPCLPASAATLLVWPDSPTPTAPYTNWATAARTIQEAVDAAQAGDTVLVTNGLYASGGRAVYGLMTNRVAVDKPVTVRSVLGPEVTAIQGYQVPGNWFGLGDGAIRCVYLTNGAVLSGFTLTNGATRIGGGFGKESGGGVWCESTNAVVTNCTLTANSAGYEGGGAFSGTLNNCTLTRNSLPRDDYSYGGGAYSGTLNYCALTGNSAGCGGGAISGTLNNCTLTGNSAAAWGGGADSAILNNCILTGNSAIGELAYRFIKTGTYS